MAIAILIFLPALILVIASIFTRPSTAQQTAVPTTPQTFALAKGTVTVPGTAYIDDLDPTANVRAELINIWQGVGNSRGRVVCSLTDGYEVQLMAAQDVSGVTWFRVQAELPEGSCDGWVREEWISSQ